MKSTPGIAGKVFCTLGSKGINIEMISMGASEINLSLAVKQKDFEKAVQALHDEFGKGAK
jgi:aspartokinase